MSDIEPTTGETYAQLSGNRSQRTEITTEKLDWRIWNIDEENDKLTLIADGLTNRVTEFSGAHGYNNGVGILNLIGKTCYSNSKLNAIGRSLNYSDLEEVMVKPPIFNQRVNLTSSGDRYFPLIHQYEEYSGIDGNIVDKGQPSMAGMSACTISDQPFFISSTEGESKTGSTTARFIY